jgi:hypothetical protein
MDEQVRQLFGQRSSVHTSLAQGGFRRDDHITQERRVQLREGSFAHGEGQHVGRLVDASIPRIEPVHASVIDNEHTHITSLTVEGCEQPLQCLFEAPRV